ncbi:MAG: NADH-quinone oxidoreductase subunit G [Betaproteobacteria bacterium RIFCSPLOWO2_12_FULL_62_13]|nr:MAG: NADH-quinone oxidoreductase subunit G [Betaproteobacteria bacterium RIFCSPLOWO2_12_FULL_62_13]
MLEIEVDGKLLEVPEGSTVMDAANQAGIYVPHFCYHRKLSIAANCRMCLVQVEKAPKPLPACATPVTKGMRVWTHSEQAVAAQKGVMEFLLINHPLDCPICDQGGECQLQDLAVGYGASGSRYEEEKRVVVNKNLGPLISTDMTRCIHCTRCVRFGQEIAGIMELGMIGRGEHSEIITFVGKTVDSELSGNVIDLCPVGALTSKPFRYTARAWELTRRPSVSPHCGLGSNLVVQVKQNRVMRVLPRENEAINECWLSDKDRFSYEGLNSEQRLAKPMLKRGGAWKEVEWQVALDFTARELKRIRDQHGAASIGAMATPHQTLEELFLLGKLAREFASGNVDFRVRQSDFSADDKLAGAPWLGMKIAEIGDLDRVLVVGSTLRKDHPLIAHRLRQAAKRATQLNLINPMDDDLLMRVAHKAIVAPAAMPHALAQVLKAAVQAGNAEIPGGLRGALEGMTVSEAAQRIAQSLVSGTNVAIFLGNLAQHHPHAVQVHALAQELAILTGARFGFLGEAANSVGGYIANAVPLGSEPRGLNAFQMLQQPRKAYLLLGLEAELDTYDPQQALSAFRQAELVLALSPYQHRAVEYAHVMLPIAPFTETAGAFINTEGTIQCFNGVVKPLGETRPAWKVLRVLGNLLGLNGFDHDSAEAVRREAAGGRNLAGKLDNRLTSTALSVIAPPQTGALQRIGEVPIYNADAIVRRASSLRKTRDAAPPAAWMNRATADKLGLRDGDHVRVCQGGGHAVVPYAVDDRLPVDCIRLAAAREETAGLGAMFGVVSAERVAAREKMAV